MRNPYLALFVGILSISIFPTLVRLNLNSPLVSAFYRMAISSVFLLPYAYLSGQLNFARRTDFYLSVLCGLIFGIDICVWNISISGSSATQATLLTNLAPLWVGLFSFLFLKNKPKGVFWVGIFFSLLGVVVYVGTETFRNMSFDLYFLFGCLSGLCYSIYILISKHILSASKVIAFVATSTTSSSVFILFFNLYQGEPFFGFNSTAWASLVFQGLVCQLLAWLLISYATRFISASRISLMLLSQAVFASFFAYILIGEQLSFQNILGGALILFGIGITIVK